MARINSTLLIISMIWTLNVVWCSDANFTKIGIFPGKSKAIKLNDQLKLVSFNSEKQTWSIQSTEGERDTCNFPNFKVFNLSALGNGKIISYGNTFEFLGLVNLENCFRPTIMYIPAVNKTGENVGSFDFPERLGPIVTYHDTFDVFDWYQKTCMPCRYNDKGELLEVPKLLKKDKSDRDPRMDQEFGYYLDEMEDPYGAKNGYFYMFRYSTGSTGMKVLDSNFEEVRQRSVDMKIEAHSVLGRNITICYKKNGCTFNMKFQDCVPDDVCTSNHCHKTMEEPQTQCCQHVACYLLDYRLNVVGHVNLHQVQQDTWGSNNVVDMIVQNLKGGGAMVAMTFRKNHNNLSHYKEVYIQRIHPHGMVDKPILFNSLESTFHRMRHFTFSNGDYCLVTVNSYDGERQSETLVKCLKPSEPDYTIA